MPVETDQADDLRARAGEVAKLLKTLSHPNRLMIACDLLEGEKSVGAIEKSTGVVQPVLSRDLARMREEGLLTARRESKAVFYQIADPRLHKLVTALCETFGGKNKR